MEIIKSWDPVLSIQNNPTLVLAEIPLFPWNDLLCTTLLCKIIYVKISTAFQQVKWTVVISFKNKAFQESTRILF